MNCCMTPSYLEAWLHICSWSLFGYSCRDFRLKGHLRHDSVVDSNDDFLDGYLKLYLMDSFISMMNLKINFYILHIVNRLRGLDFAPELS